MFRIALYHVHDISQNKFQTHDTTLYDVQGGSLVEKAFRCFYRSKATPNFQNPIYLMRLRQILPQSRRMDRGR